MGRMEPDDTQTPWEPRAALIAVNLSSLFVRQEAPFYFKSVGPSPCLRQGAPEQSGVLGVQTASTIRGKPKGRRPAALLRPALPQCRRRAKAEVTPGGLGSGRRPCPTAAQRIGPPPQPGRSPSDPLPSGGPRGSSVAGPEAGTRPGWPVRVPLPAGIGALGLRPTGNQVADGGKPVSSGAGSWFLLS